MSRKIGYRRVSSVDQNLDRQDLAFCDRVFEDKMSGKSAKRPELEKMMEFIWTGDEVYVWSIDRLARSMVDCDTLVKQILSKGASVQFMSEKLDFRNSMSDSEPIAVLQFQMMGAFAEFERNILRRRQREGVQHAKEEGRYKGGKPQINRSDLKRRLELGLSVSQTAREMNISRSSVYSIARELGFEIVTKLKQVDPKANSAPE